MRKCSSVKYGYFVGRQPWAQPVWMTESKETCIHILVPIQYLNTNAPISIKMIYDILNLEDNFL